MTDDNSAGAAVSGPNVQDANKRRPHLMSKFLVELIGINPADVVRLDDGVQVSHRHRLSVARKAGPGRADVYVEAAQSSESVNRSPSNRSLPAG